MPNLSQKTMFYATWRESKRSQSLIGLVFAFALFFSLFLPAFANATTIWQGGGSSQSIESVIGDSLIGGNNGFGWSIDSDNNVAVVGYPSYDNEAGAVYILQHNDDDSWTKLAKLTAPISQPNIAATEDDSKISGAHFGWSVAISGDTVVVGSPSDQRELVNEVGRSYIRNFGAAYVFTKPAGGWADSSDAIKLNGFDQELQEGFGWSVDIANNTVVVGSRGSQIYGKGAIYVYNKPVDGWVSTSSSVAVLVGPENGDGIGYSVAIDSNAKVIVAGGTNNKNHVVVFTNTSGDWSSYSGPQNLTVDSLNSQAGFGISVAVSESGDTIVVGARNDQSAGAYVSWGAGAAYVFYSPGAVWSADNTFAIARLTASDPQPDFTQHQPSAIFGESVAIKDDVIIVGSPWHKASTGQAVGAIYVFTKPAGGWTNTTENIQLLGVNNGNTYQNFGRDVVFLDNQVFSIATLNNDGSAGFSLFPITESYASFLGTPTALDNSNGQVTGTVSVFDLDNNLVDLKVEFSLDGNNWQSATFADVYDDNGPLATSTIDSITAITGIAENNFGHTINFVWDSAIDGVGQSATVYLRVTPVGGVGSVSSVFAVNNPIVLSAPTGLGVSNITTSSLNLFWDLVAGASSYNVSSTAGTLLVTTSTSATFTGLVSSTEYFFQVNAFDAAGNVSAYSAVFSTSTLAVVDTTTTTTTDPGTDTTPPTVPTGLVLSATTSTITISWDVNADAVGYNVSSTVGALLTTTGTSATFFGLAGSTEYFFQINSFDTAGNTSTYSSVFSTTTLSYIPPTPPAIPSSNFVFTAGTSTILMSWDSVSGATGYTVYSNALASTTATVDTNSFQFTGLTANTLYQFKVNAFEGSGLTSDYSNTYSVYTLANVPVVTSVEGRDYVTLFWTGDASQYLAKRAGTDDTSWTTSTSATFDSLTCNTAYSFVVRGRNASNIETANASTTVTTNACGQNGGGDDQGQDNNDQGNGRNSGGSYNDPGVPTVSSVSFAQTSPVSSSIINILSSVSNAAEMIISEDQNFVSSTWEAYSGNQQYTLSEGDGEKTVYIKFRSATGGVTGTNILRITVVGTDGVGGAGPEGEDDDGQGNVIDNDNGNANDNDQGTNNDNDFNDNQVINSNNNGNSNNSGNSSNGSSGNDNQGQSNNNSQNNGASSNLPVSGNDEGGAPVGTNLPLVINIPGGNSDNGFIPTAQAGGTATGFGSNLRNYLGRAVNSESYWVIALAILVALAGMVGGWFAFGRKKSDDDNKVVPPVAVKKDEKEDNAPKQS